MATLSEDAVLAVYLDKNGREIQREVLSAAARGRQLQNEDPDFIDPWKVMTVEINCLAKDRPVFAEQIKARLGPPGATGGAIEWYYTLQNATDDRSLRYVFDTNHRVPLEIFAQLIKTLTTEDSSRCQTVKMVVCGGCIFPCRPKICNGKASCGFAPGCPCP